MSAILTKSLIIGWLVANMLKWAPPENRNSFIPEAKEPVAEARVRYERIAEGFLDVALDEHAPHLVGGEQGRLQTAMLMAGVALYESGFRRDVHLGIGKLGRGDHGRSWCLMQINLGKGKVPTQDPLIGSWFGTDLVGLDNTSKCARTGLHLMMRSMQACRALPWQDRLSAYTSGTCHENERKGIARLRFGVWQFNRNRPTFTDKQAQEAWKRKKIEDVSTN